MTARQLQRNPAGSVLPPGSPPFNRNQRRPESLTPLPPLNSVQLPIQHVTPSDQPRKQAADAFRWPQPFSPAFAYRLASVSGSLPGCALRRRLFRNCNLRSSRHGTSKPKNRYLFLSCMTGSLSACGLLKLCFPFQNHSLTHGPAGTGNRSTPMDGLVPEKDKTSLNKNLSSVIDEAAAGTQSRPVGL